MIFSLGEDQWHGYETEALWAEQVTEDRYRLRNTPFYVRGVSFEDIVFVQRRDNSLWYVGTSLASGHSTYRVIFEKAKSERRFVEYWEPLQKLGCSYESAEYEQMRLLAIDVPPRVDIQSAYELLSRGEHDRIWEFEEGHCGHQV